MTTRIPSKDGLQGPALDDLVRRDVGRELRHELGDRSGADVAESLQPRDHDAGLCTDVGAIDAAAFLGALEDRHEDLEQKALRPRHLHACPGELERRLEQRRPRQPPVLRMGVGEARHEPGHGDRRGPDVEQLRRRVAEIDQHLVHGALWG